MRRGVRTSARTEPELAGTRKAGARQRWHAGNAQLERKALLGVRTTLPGPAAGGAGASGAAPSAQRSAVSCSWGARLLVTNPLRWGQKQDLTCGTPLSLVQTHILLDTSACEGKKCWLKQEAGIQPCLVAAVVCHDCGQSRPRSPEGASVPPRRPPAVTRHRGARAALTCTAL